MAELNGTHILSGIRWHELSGSGQATYGDSPQTTRRFLVDFDQADQFCGILVGQSIQIGGAIQIWGPPVRDPDRPWLYCRQATKSGYGKGSRELANGAIAYNKAIVTATFRVLDRDPNQQQPDTQTYVTESQDGQFEQMTVPGNNLFWNGDADDPLVDDDGRPKQIAKVSPESTYVYTVHNWFNAPVDSPDNPFMEAMGKVNRDRFRILHTWFPAETLMFQNHSFDRDFTSEGVTGWRVSLFFGFHPQTWQKILDPRDLKWKTVETEGGDKLYETDSFKDLLP